MKLSTYNFLTSKSIRGVKVGYPLKLVVSSLNPSIFIHKFFVFVFITSTSTLFWFCEMKSVDTFIPSCFNFITIKEWNIRSHFYIYYYFILLSWNDCLSSHTYDYGKIRSNFSLRTLLYFVLFITEVYFFCVYIYW